MKSGKNQILYDFVFFFEKYDRWFSWMFENLETVNKLGVKAMLNHKQVSHYTRLMRFNVIKVSFSINKTSRNFRVTRASILVGAEWNETQLL